MQLYWRDRNLEENQAFRAFVMSYYCKKERLKPNFMKITEETEKTGIVKDYMSRQCYSYTRFFTTKLNHVVAVILKKTWGRVTSLIIFMLYFSYEIK